MATFQAVALLLEYEQVLIATWPFDLLAIEWLSLQIILISASRYV